MFWWGRVNSIIAIIAFGGSALFLMSGKVGETIVLWILIILLRVALIVCNVLYTAIVGAPLFYDTRIQYEQQQAQEPADRVVDDE
ncbi:MAG: hypothetical protein MEQ74_04990 [Paracoccus sp.]|nr:hypothetical protein [Paracoccus sp. (in: a-proteobacteria)]